MFLLQPWCDSLHWCVGLVWQLSPDQHWPDCVSQITQYLDNETCLQPFRCCCVVNQTWRKKRPLCKAIFKEKDVGKSLWYQPVFCLPAAPQSAQFPFPGFSISCCKRRRLFSWKEAIMKEMKLLGRSSNSHTPWVRLPPGMRPNNCWGGGSFSGSLNGEVLPVCCTYMNLRYSHGLYYSVIKVRPPVVNAERKRLTIRLSTTLTNLHVSLRSLPLHFFSR